MAIHPQDSSHNSGHTDLHALSGLAITADNAALALRFGPGVSAPEPARRRAGEMRPVLLDADAARADDVAYTLYRGVTPDEAAEEIERRGLLYVALVARAGKLGPEWVRTRGHTNSPAPGTPLPFPEVHEVWQGRALLYLQTEAAPDVTDVVAMEMGPGDKAVVPPGWAGLVANIGAEPLALGSWRARECVPRYDALESLHGMAHFVLAGDGPGAYRFEPNTRYRSVPVPRPVPAQDYPKLGLHKSEPMYTTFRRNPDSLRFMTRPQDHENVWTALYP